MASAAATGRSCVRLAWCVRQEADYEAIKGRLPASRDIGVSIYATKGLSAAASGEPPVVAGAFITRFGKPANGAKTLALASVSTTLLALVVGHWVWEKGLAKHLRHPESLVDYAITYR